jgi:hypothetical protein
MSVLASNWKEAKNWFGNSDSSECDLVPTLCTGISNYSVTCTFQSDFYRELPKREQSGTSGCPRLLSRLIDSHSEPPPRENQPACSSHLPEWTSETTCISGNNLYFYLSFKPKAHGSQPLCPAAQWKENDCSPK